MVKGIIARLRDMLDTIEELERATAGKTFEAFQRDWLLRKAAERGVEIISEASRHLPEDLKTRHPYARWRHVAGIGNVLRHEYHRVEDRIVWSVIRDELPRLKVSIWKRCEPRSRAGHDRTPTPADGAWLRCASGDDSPCAGARARATPHPFT